LITQIGCLNEKDQAEKILKHYIDQKVEMIRNFHMESAVALWNATVSGKEKDYQRLINIELDFNKSNQSISNLFSPDRFSSITQNVFTNVQDFELLKKLKFSGLITDSLMIRQLNVLYQEFMGSQFEQEKYKELSLSEIKLGQAFSSLKVELNGKKYGIKQLDSIRKNSHDTLMVRKIFEAMRQKGMIIVPDIIRMVKDRNEFSVRFGYPDFYQLALETKDQTPPGIKQILDDIELKTREPFFEAKSVIDKILAKRFGIPVSELKPWHYNDERTSYLPESFTLKMDSLFTNVDPIRKTAEFFEGIGLPIQNVIDNSDLEYRPEKSSLTAMINVDFRNDIRLIAGIRNSYDGMYRMMHLGGHASHYNSISDSIPFLLKTPISAIYEGVARYFENLASNYNWLKDEVSIDQKKQEQIVRVCEHLHHVDRLIRCRRLLVMAEFEREIYQKPDQDLDSLWTKLNLKYLGINYPSKKNSCYWTTNKFSTSLSCTTHNLVLADVFAAQLQHAVEKNVLKQTNGSYANNKEVGKYLVNNLYRYGNLLPWEQLVKKATGESLNSKYFVEEITGNEANENDSIKQNGKTIKQVTHENKMLNR
jgi:peptidyl-dipeptidase A